MTLHKLIDNAILVWALLVVVTLLTWVLVEENLTDVAIYIVIILSSAKVYLIGVSYMEIFRANHIFRNFYHIWILLVLLMIGAFKYVYF
ncbi:MAG: cytochrome C oxidase subunit IV family protein [Porticoccaceae bacterium]|nr:cytochrome C oxidase subunit IV family protein [Pseudomonadales bacterium]MCP5172137.1 cytochrome C oxidase subunit IV family protein [Pseudomonadales bacterium]